MLRSFLTGLVRAGRGWQMILLLLAVNLLVSIPVVTPIFLLIAQTTGQHQAANAMLADALDPHWLTDFINQQLAGESLASVGGQVGVLLLVSGVIYLLLNTLLAGGILEVLANGGRFTVRGFWAGCGAYFWRFFRLLLISLLFYGLAYLVYYLVSRPIDTAAERAAAFAPIAYKRWAATALLVLLLALVNMIFDYARIGAVVGGRRKMIRESIGATRFALRHFFGAYALYWLVAVVGLAAFALLAWLRAKVPQTSILAVLAALLLGQAAMLARMWTRLSFYAVELDFYRQLSPRTSAVVEEEAVPADASPSELVMEESPELPVQAGGRFAAAEWKEAGEEPEKDRPV